MVGNTPHLFIGDSDLADFKPLDLVRELLLIDATVNTAVVSHLSEEQFHETSEGLGVLTHLPAEPGKGDGAELLGKLRRVLG